MAAVIQQDPGAANRRWVKRLLPGDLPVLAQSIGALSDLAALDNPPAAHVIAEHVRQDPLMLLRLIAFMNNRGGHINHEIASIEHAIMMMGVNPFFRQFGKLPCAEAALSDKPWALSALLKITERARHAMIQAHDFAVLRKDVRAEEVMLGAGLRELPEMLLWLLEPESARKVTETAREQRLTAAQAQEQVLGCTLAELQQPLAEAWNLPEVIRVLMDRNHSDLARVQCAQLAAELATVTQEGWGNPALQDTLNKLARCLHMPSDQAQALVTKNARLAARSGLDIGAADPEKAPPASAAPAQPVAAQSVTARPAVHGDARIVQAMLREIDAHLDETLDLATVVNLVLEGIEKGVGMPRTLFALLTPDRKQLTTRFVREPVSTRSLKETTIEIAPSYLLGCMMARTQAVWLSAVNAAKIEPYVGMDLRAQIGPGEFFAMSVFVQDKPVGLLYADRNGKPLDDGSYQQFKALGLRAAQGLAHLAA